MTVCIREDCTVVEMNGLELSMSTDPILSNIMLSKTCKGARHEHSDISCMPISEKGQN